MPDQANRTHDEERLTELKAVLKRQIDGLGQLTVKFQGLTSSYKKFLQDAISIKRVDRKSTLPPNKALKNEEFKDQANAYVKKFQNLNIEVKRTIEDYKQTPTGSNMAEKVKN